jgi:hypothetical protein
MKFGGWTAGGGIWLGATEVIGFNGGQGRDRTADAGLFRAALYH